jgi:hypothetical protein
VNVEPRRLQDFKNLASNGLRQDINHLWRVGRGGASRFSTSIRHDPMWDSRLCAWLR